MKTFSATLGAMLLLCGVAQASRAETAPPPLSPIRMNQLGFLPWAAKRAVVPDASSQPLRWRLLDKAGATVAVGLTRVFGPDAASGQHLHTLDFSGVRQEGVGYRLVVGEGAATRESRPFAISAATYSRLKDDALGYFYQTRAGVPIEPRFVSDPALARPAGHPVERLTCFSGPDTHGAVWPGCSYRLDVTGGWYDAGDQGKYVVNGGVSAWTLLDLHEALAARGGAQPFRDGSARIPQAGNGVDDLLDEARYELDFLMAMQAPERARLRLPVGPQRPGQPLVFTEIDAGGMAHQKVSDARWTPLPTRPDRDPEPRFLYPPTTGATLNLAAAAGQCARVFRTLDPAYARRCLAVAQRAYAAARRHPDVYAVGDFTGGGGYGDHDLTDEFFWAAAELYAATGESRYLDDLHASPVWSGLPASAVDIGWPSTATAGLMTLSLAADSLPAEDRRRVDAALVAGADRSLADEASQGYAIPYAPAGYPWGSNSVILNRAIVLARAADLTGQARYRDAVVDAMDYVLGRNPLDQSFVTGYGARPMRNPHHRFWAHMLDPRYPSPPPGVVSGGPNSTAFSDPVAAKLRGHCAPMTCWADDTRAYALNEVAINWNAPLLWVATWLDQSRPAPRPRTPAQR